MKLDTKAFEDKMKKTIAVLEEEFACIRIGRASARVLDKITVPYYGTPTAVDGVATVKAIDARTLAITPWETNMLKPLLLSGNTWGIIVSRIGKKVNVSLPNLQLRKVCAGKNSIRHVSRITPVMKGRHDNFVRNYWKYSPKKTECVPTYTLS